MAVFDFNDVDRYAQERDTVQHRGLPASIASWSGSIVYSKAVVLVTKMVGFRGNARSSRGSGLLVAR